MDPDLLTDDELAARAAIAVPREHEPQLRSDSFPSRIWALQDVMFEETTDGHLLVAIRTGRYTEAEVMLSCAYATHLADTLKTWAAAKCHESETTDDE